MKLNISIGNSRMDKRWNQVDLSLEDFKARIASTRYTAETVSQYAKMSKAQQDDIKDVGGFVMGSLKGGRRKKDCVIDRCGLTLDMDYATPNIIETIEILFSYHCWFYSTHKHKPDKPRLRLIIPLSRPVSPDEYIAIGRRVAADIGIELFDDTTYEPSRLMYWPSTSSDGEFIFHEIKGELLDPDEVLSRYKDWRNTAEWPVSKRQQEIVQRETTKVSDPLEKNGTVGAFCRAYSIPDAIETFLGDVYKPSLMPDRFDYIPADSQAGLVVYDDKFAYSHHATDPVHGRLLNAFDLVRGHRFADMEEKASFGAMCELAISLDPVKILLSEERVSEAQAEFTLEDKDWRTLLKYQSKSKLLENSVWNEMLILTHDPNFAGFAYNELAQRVEVIGELPWERPADNRFWRDADTAQLKAVLDVRYLAFSSRNHDVCFTKTADDRRFHPIRNYLNNLPAWDGVPRIESLLVRCLQAEDTPYVRAVTRKTLVAAVARIYRPGTKFDSVLVIDGVQGIGKSTLFKDLTGEEYYSETLSLTDMDDKSGAEKLQGFWVVEIGELAGMKKADIEKVKAFLSTSDDKYRPSYGKTVESHPRQCIIIASVNGERGYLRDITGNRRFWVVKAHQEEPVKRWQFTSEERDQIWAEAKMFYARGEKLYLEGDLVKSAEAVQREAMEIDERQGAVEEYLNRLLPENWDSMDIYQRRNYMSDRSDPTHPKGVRRRKEVSNLEIWCECLGRNMAELKPVDSYALAALMSKVEGWVRTKDIVRQLHYGRQRVYKRTRTRSRS